MSKYLLPCPKCMSKIASVSLYVTQWRGLARHYYVGCCAAECLYEGPESSTQMGAVNAWNDLPRNLTWTREKPSDPGWYWIRSPLKPAHIIHTIYGTDCPEGDYEYAGPIRHPKENM